MVVGRRGRAKLRSLPAFFSLEGSLAGSKVRTSFGADSSFRINFPVSRPRSGMALAVASDRTLATITTDKRSVYKKGANTVIPSEPHEKNNTFVFIVFLGSPGCC